MDIDGAADELLKSIGKIIVEQESLQMVDNETRIELVNKCFSSLKKIISGAKITMHLHEPFNSMGYISIIGENYSINNPTLFASICKSASNIEVYPQTDGKVVINISFHRISQIIRGGESQ